MSRFIYVCMAIVALCLLGVAGQFLYKHAAPARSETSASTQPAPAAETAAAANPERLNGIETSAGYDPDDKFEKGFLGLSTKDPEPAHR